MDNSRNLILAVVLTGLLLFGWDAGMKYFYPNANKPKAVASAPANAAPGTAAATKPTRDGGIERDFAKLRDELSAALARAAAGKGDPPRRRR